MALLLAGLALGCARSSASTAEPPAVAAATAADPSEEITPEELATIPEPVPVNAEGTGGFRPRAPLPVAERAPEEGSRANESGSADPRKLWWVQVLATQERALADRTAVATGDMLRVEAHVTYEPPLYKVRLGGYATEKDATQLRLRAIRAGFPGAFRILCAPGASDAK